MKRAGRLLCLLGRHRWHYFAVNPGRCCWRCGRTEVRADVII